VAIILLYIYYASKSSCSLNIFFITINLILCLIVSVVSVLPMVQNYHSTSGLLQSSFVTLYVVFLTWSAMASGKPGRTCSMNNIKRNRCIRLIYLDPICNPSWHGILTNNSTSTDTSAVANGSVSVPSVVALIIFFALIIYSAYVFDLRMKRKVDKRTRFNDVSFV
jgi:serine incorporator 1/3